MSTTPATDIIREAEALTEQKQSEWSLGEKFDSALSYALYELVLNGYSDDELEDGRGGYIWRVDRWLLLQDSSGFVNHREHDRELHAVWSLDNIRQDINEYC